jgi:hypothetical protein
MPFPPTSPPCARSSQAAEDSASPLRHDRLDRLVGRAGLLRPSGSCLESRCSESDARTEGPTETLLRGQSRMPHLHAESSGSSPLSRYSSAFDKHSPVWFKKASVSATTPSPMPINRRHFTAPAQHIEPPACVAQEVARRPAESSLAQVREGRERRCFRQR